MATSEVVVLAPAFEKELADRERPGAFRRTVRPWLNKPLGVIGLAIIAFMAVLSLGAPFLQRYEPTETFQIPNSNYDPNSTNYRSTDTYATLLDSKAEPSAKHWLGTDDGGRDIWSRIVWGTRRSLGIGIASLIFGSVIGGALGVLSGYFSGRFDTLLQRVLDALQAFPPLLLLILAFTALEPSVRNF